MNDDDRFGRPDGAPEHDPLADFFAAEREGISPQPADDVRWQGILRESRRARRAGWWRYAAAAAAVVVVGGTAWGVAQRHGGAEVAGTPTVTKTVYVEGPTSARSSAPATPTDATTAPLAPPATGATGAPAPTPVPSDFTVSSVTTVGSGRLFALGAATCGGSPCAAVATSGDQGATWSLRGSIPGATVAPRTAGAEPALLGTASTVTSVRFATDDIGWAFGAGVWRTADGGRTWAPYSHGGGAAVVDLETDKTDVVLTTTDSCNGQLCSGPVQVVRAPRGAASATDVAGSFGAGQGVVAADVLWYAGKALVAVRGSELVAPQVLETGGLRATTLPTCPTTQGPLTVVAPASGTTLFGLCPPQGSAGHLSYAVASSPDGGATWASVSDTGPQVVDAGTVSAAASDATHLLVVSGGRTDLHGSLMLSSDGGQTWSTPAGAPATPDRGWAWVGSPGASTFYALPSDPTGGFWRSTDNGVTWSEVRVAG